MKTKRKYLIIIGLVVILLVYGLICGYSKSTVTTTVVKTEIGADDTLALSNLQLPDDSSTLVRKSKTEMNINGSKTYKTQNYKTVYWFLSKKIGGGRFIPWFKPIHFNADVLYKWSSEINVNKTDTVLHGMKNIKINGEMSITGLIYPERAKHKIEKLLEQTIQQEIVKDIDAKTKNLKTNINEK